jgi:hypothetical protein
MSAIYLILLLLIAYAHPMPVFSIEVFMIFSQLKEAFCIMEILNLCIAVYCFLTLLMMPFSSEELLILFKYVILFMLSF